MKYVREMEGLRGVMALWVVLGHLASTVALDNVLLRHKLGNGLAVDVFILLSGFAIAAMVDKTPEDYRTYITRRVLRIFPVYLLFLALSIAMAPLALDVWSAAPAGAMREARIQIAKDSLTYFWPHVTAHALALQGIVPPRLLPSTDFAFLGQAWSISLEWQFYLIAPMLIAWLAKARSRWQLGAAVVCALTLASASHFMPDGFLGKSLHQFLIGIASFHLVKARAQGEGPAAHVPLGFAWAAMCSLCVLAGKAGGVPYVIWASTLAIVVAKMEGGGPISNSASALLCSRPVQFLGKLAYSAYLSHMLVLVLVLLVLQGGGLGPYESALLLTAMTLIGTILVAMASFYAVEKRCHDFGRSLRHGTARAPQNKLSRRRGEDLGAPPFAKAKMPPDPL